MYLRQVAPTQADFSYEVLCFDPQIFIYLKDFCNYLCCFRLSINQIYFHDKNIITFRSKRQRADVITPKFWVDSGFKMYIKLNVLITVYEGLIRMWLPV